MFSIREAFSIILLDGNFLRNKRRAVNLFHRNKIWFNLTTIFLSLVHCFCDTSRDIYATIYFTTQQVSIILLILHNHATPSTTQTHMTESMQINSLRHVFFLCPPHQHIILEAMYRCTGKNMKCTLLVCGGYWFFVFRSHFDRDCKLCLLLGLS